VYRRKCDFSEDYDAFERAGTIVLPISVDSVPTLKEYKAKHAMRQDLLSDFKREVSRAYGSCSKIGSSRSARISSSTNRASYAGATSRQSSARRDDVELPRQIATL